MSKLKDLFDANEKLGLKEDMSIPKNTNIIFVYTSAKCGSTSLVSTLRLNCFEKFTVVHLHNDKMLKVLYNIDNVSIAEIIEFNRVLKKNIWVFDIFRHPIEHRMSLYFEIIDTFHFNVNTEDIKSLTIDKVINRFNNIFPHILLEDYFQNVYRINNEFDFTFDFDFEKGYTLIECNQGIKYVKLRLMDANTKWASILSELLKQPVYILNDNLTNNKKNINQLYTDFKSQFKLPHNFLVEISEMDLLMKYLTADERHEYIKLWESKTQQDLCVTPYSTDEYFLYLKISKENKHLNQYHFNHYLDNGCDCHQCCSNRTNLLASLQKNPGVASELNQDKNDKAYNHKQAKKRGFSLAFL
jgi:hypothetical protein